MDRFLDEMSKRYGIDIIFKKACNICGYENFKFFNHNNYLYTNLFIKSYYIKK